MDNNKEILIIGGDDRFTYTKQYFENRKFVVNTARTKDEIKNKIKAADVIILPLPVSRDGINLNEESEKIPLDFISDLIQDNQTIAGGMFSPDCEKLFTLNGKKPFDYFKIEEMALKNAIPTAEGVIGIIINRLPFTVDNAKIAVLGYGKCGKKIADKLYYLNGDVTVVARNEDSRKNALYRGLGVCDFKDFGKICDKYEIIVNTVPYPVVGEEILSKLNKNCTVIEIASAPFGVDFNTAQKYEINVIKASSLPAKTSPKTAGEIIAETIIDNI